MGFGSWLGRQYRKIDGAVFQGVLPGGPTPYGEGTLVGDAVRGTGSAIGDGVGKGVEGFNSAWDILSGNRDRRFQGEQADLAYDRQRDLLRDTAGLQMQGLAAAGINPILAGQLGSGAPSVAGASGGGGNAGGLAGAINSASSALSSIINLRKSSSEIDALRANTRKTIADAGFVEASTPLNLRNLDFQGGLLSANTAESRERSKKIAKEVERYKLQMPQFHAESEYYKRYGYGAVLADKNRNPWQSAQLVGSQAGRTIEARPDLMERALNSASDVVSSALQRAAERQAANKRNYDRHRTRMFMRR